jgi:hypothetical protein
MKTLMFILFLFSPILILSQQRNEIAAIELTKMNILYLGVDNPVKVAVSGCKASDLKLTATNASISESHGTFYVRPQTPGKVTLSVSCQGKLIRAAEFRVRMVPYPIARVGGIKEQTVSLNLLAAQKFLVAELSDFEFDLSFKITQFQMSITVNGFNKKFRSDSNMLTNEQLSEIRKLKRGQSVYFDDIKAKGPDGIVRKLSSFSLKIK